MKNSQAKTTYLKHYKPPAFFIERTDLVFDLYEDKTIVTSKLLFNKNKNFDDDSLVLHGRDLVLEALFLNKFRLTPADYVEDDETLTIPNLSAILEADSDQFTMTCITRIEPQKNMSLEGLYKSNDKFCTQCEAEGFRKITYYLDRPDVMSLFTTKIIADKKEYPVLLSNGNKIDEGIVDGDIARHWVSWEDPFKKPSYLFALVAGNLVSFEDQFVTCSGRAIKLQIFVESKDIEKCDHAMQSLKNAMRWDEEVYGREYDLDIFMIVAVDDFNMGAMENKGLNIFNTSCVLANPKTTTDSSFQRVEAVVAHEYFHNWSGNRVTCRDWFQLSLKEGFTVFRDSEFSADMGSRVVKRVEDVAFLKTVQFAEDSGPMAHSVRPESYMEISNFYTVTIYEKGAEVVRMISEILGAAIFREATDLYFSRFDGQAVTTEDFVKVMEEVSEIDLQQFRLWYSQAGTPEITVNSFYNEKEKTYSLAIKQSCKATPGQSSKKPFFIPMRMGLLNQQGNEIPLVTDKDKINSGKAFDQIITITEQEQEVVFYGVESKPIPSLLRNFSAPVRLKYLYTQEELYFLMVHDTDGFNRWNAAQSLATEVITSLQSKKVKENAKVSSTLCQAFKSILNASVSNDGLDKAMVAHLLALPTEGSLIEQAEEAAVENIHLARETVSDFLANELTEEFSEVYESNIGYGEYSSDSSDMARRALKNLSLGYLVRTGKKEWIETCFSQFNRADNMTDQLAALRCLVIQSGTYGLEESRTALDSFYEQWKHEPLVVDQWLITQALCPSDDTLDRVKDLRKHQAFEIKNPNKVRSLIGTFCSQNHVQFHELGGQGYEFLGDCIIELDQINPQIAARLTTPLTRWRKYDHVRQALIQAQLQRIKEVPELSKDVFEVVEKSTIL